MTRLGLRGAALLVAGALLLGACGGGGQTESPPPAASGGGGSPAGEATRVTFWGDWSGEGERQFDTMVAAFNEAHPDIVVDYVVVEDMLTKFLTASTAGEAPDVMFWDRWRTALYAPKGVLEPIDDYIASDGVDRSLFYDEALRELSYEDQLYGLPITVDARALFYNKDHLAEAGLEPPTTWEELAQAAEALTVRKDDGSLERAGFSLGDVGLFNMYLQQAGGQMVADDCSTTTFNTAEGRQVLEYWDRLMDAGVYEVGFEEGLGEGTDAFVTGQVSMLYTGPWNISTYQQYGDELDFGIVPPPAGPAGEATLMGGFGLVIPSAAKQKEAAWEFVRWWTAEAQNSMLWAETSLNIPGNKETIADPFFQDDPFWKPILDSLEFAKVRPTCAGYSPMEVESLIPQLQLFMEGNQSIDETLANAEEQGNRLLAEGNVEP